MKNKGIIIFLLLVAIGIAIWFGTRKKDEGTPIVSGDVTIYPENFPGKRVTGIDFPTNANTIEGWTTDTRFASQYDSVSIYRHAWGIWAGLTAETKQRVKGEKRNLLVYETWMGINEVRDLIEDNVPIVAGSKKGFTERKRAPLTRPHQFEHAGIIGGKRKITKTKAKTAGAAPTGFWVTVSYSPKAAQYASENKILRQSALNQYYNPGQVGNIPAFPNDAITIKPTYLVYSSKDELLQMPVWLNPPNPPDSIPTNGFGAPEMEYSVYVDTRNSQPKNKKLVPVLSSSTDKKAIQKATCNLSDFISFKLDQDMVNLMVQQDDIQGVTDTTAAAGDLAILVAMHVTTKEISNWTWQTYYWTPTPENPGAPSSKLARSLMPKEVKGAARHYAANAAYVMTTPNNSAAATAGTMFGFNPYLEGGFGPSTFTANQQFPNLKYGMQSNCMSCHAMAVAIANPPAANFVNLYNTDEFVDINGATFKNRVRVDFAWSIQQNVINDATPYYGDSTAGPGTPLAGNTEKKKKQKSQR